MNQKRYWLRGGLLFLIIGLVLSFYFGGQFCASYNYQTMCKWTFDQALTGWTSTYTLIFYTLPLFVIGPIILGFLIGWLYGKTKK